MNRRRADREGEAESGNKVPPALLEEVFALNEELDTVRELRAEARRPSSGRAVCRQPANRSSESAPSTRPIWKICSRGGMKW